MRLLKARTDGKRKPVGYLPQKTTELTLKLLGNAFKQLSEFSDDQSNWLAFKAKYQHQSWLSKYCSPDRDGAELRRDAAIRKWLGVDFANERSNFRIQFDECNFAFPSKRDGTATCSSERILSSARDIIVDIIGEEPPVDLFDLGQFTNGASTGVSRSAGAIAQKFVGKAETTEAAWPYFSTLLDSKPGWRKLATEFGLTPVFVDSSVMFTVPKNSDIDRVACKEPEINMFLQRAVGNFFRQSLLKRGRINLSDQRSTKRLRV